MLLNIILFLLPVLLIVILELILRIFGYGTDLRLFTKSHMYKGYMEINQKVGERYFTRLEITKPAFDIFLINKPDTCYRIFVMGESAAMGFPYEIGNSFSRILYSRLQDAFPHKRIEVINTAMTAVNSYTMLDFTDEILDQKPDAIIIYTGHNEYYGAMGVGSVENGGNVRWLKLLHLKLIHFRLYQLIQSIVTTISKNRLSDTNYHRRETLMERIVKDKSIGYGSKMYYAGIEQFHKNMEELLKKAKNAGVPVIISDLACNIRDVKPFKSITSGKYPGAGDVFNDAQKLEAKGDYNEAKKEYYEAKDLDAIRFRASEDLNATINELGQKYNDIVVPMKGFFEQNSPHNLIGDNLMTEHLHPNINGYFLMADVFFNTMWHAKMISNSWNTTLIKPSIYYRNNWGFTTLDSLIADLKIKKLKAGWPFQPDTVINRFKFTYKPSSVEDSIAFLSVKHANITNDKIHEKMASYYANQGKFYKAFKEYYSLIKCYPYRRSLYMEGFGYLLKAKEFNKAYELIKSVPGFDTTYDALIQLGKIYLDQNNFNQAIYYFEKAGRNIKSESDKKSYCYLIYNTYNKAGYKSKADEMAAKITSFDPKFKLSSSGMKKMQIVVLSKTAKDYVETAKSYLEKGNLDKALVLLYKANNLQECTYVNLLIGNILFQKRDTLALNYLGKAYIEIPEDPLLLDKLCRLYIIKHDSKNATRMLNELKLVTTDTARIQKLSEMIKKYAHTKR